MFLPPTIEMSPVSGFPHVGGDVSQIEGFFNATPWFSPRRWGCFQVKAATVIDVVVFPT